jgi:hypothetical protein
MIDGSLASRLRVATAGQGPEQARKIMCTCAGSEADDLVYQIAREG